MRWDEGRPTDKWLEEMLAAEPTDGCIDWPFGNDGHGYPSVGGGNPGFRRTQKVSHIVLERTGRPRPEGLFALHSCDRPVCVNPRHLAWGTNQENLTQMVERGRWAGSRVDNPYFYNVKGE